MRYSGIQPQYFPRLHYFARILNADIFVFRDDVQFVRKHKYPDGKVGKSYQVHSTIKHADGVKLLTVPVLHNGRQSLAETKVSYDMPWIDDHLKAFMYAYHKAPNFEKIHSELTSLLYAKYQTIAELNTATILWGILKLLGEESVTSAKLTLPFVQSRLQETGMFRLQQLAKESDTEAAKHPETKKNERIIALCHEVGANEDYCGGTATAAYVDHSQFENAGVKITVQDWHCIEYKQQYKKQGFISNLSIIDLLMNVPQKEAIEVLDCKKQSTSHNAISLVYGMPFLEPEAYVFFLDMLAIAPRGVMGV